MEFIKDLFNKNLFKTDGNIATIFIRCMVGLIFLLEGTHKLFTDAGVEKFTNIGFSNPEFIAVFVSSFEIVSGLLVLIGLATRIAAIPLVIIMIVAILTTKIPMFDVKGTYDVLHAARLDFSLLLAGIFLFLKGAGRYSIDYMKFSK